MWEPREVGGGVGVLGSCSAVDPRRVAGQGGAVMKPQQTPGPEVRWGWYSSQVGSLAYDNHTGICVRGWSTRVTQGLRLEVGASHRLCHFLICHKASKALTGLLAPILQGSLRQSPQRSVTMGRN